MSETFAQYLMNWPCNMKTPSRSWGQDLILNTETQDIVERFKVCTGFGDVVREENG